MAGGAQGMSMLSIGLSAFGDVEKGAGQNAADQFQADKATQAAQVGRLQANLTDTTMTENLNKTLGNIDAVRAAAHDDPTSPTAGAVEAWQTELSNRQRLAAVGTQRAQAAEDDASADYLKQAGQFALKQSYLNAATDVLGAAAKGFGTGGGAGNLGTGGMGLPRGAATGGLY
jgi:hypothetical protein